MPSSHQVSARKLIGLGATQVAAKGEARGTNRAINGQLDLVDWTVYVAVHVDHIEYRDVR